MPGDVTFPLSPDGLNNRVRVHVYRTGARTNPVPTLMGQFFGVTQVNIDAVATAEVSPANAMTCVKPFTIPDRWIEKQDPGGWDPELDLRHGRQQGIPWPIPISTSPPATRRTTPATTPNATRACRS